MDELMGDLSKNFNKIEFRCKCGCGQDNVDPKLIVGLQELRNLVAKPIKITRGFTCPKHNVEVGGQTDSQHLFGKAVDAYCPGMDLVDFFHKAAIVRLFDLGGIGIYPGEGILHLDVRGKKARWARVDGKYVGIEEGIKRWKETTGQ